MTTNQKVLNLLGLAMRARKLVTGEELVVSEIQKQSAKLIFVANDASENTKKKITDKSSYYQVAVSIHFSHDELSQAIGANRKVIAVLDQGFAKKMKELLREQEGDIIE